MVYDPRGMYLGRLRELGTPEHLVQGIDMNAWDESGYNPAASGDSGNAYGILQWNGPRKRALFRFANERGMDPSDPRVQADFTHYEGQTSERAAWEAGAAAGSPGEAGAIWVNQFERPAEEHRAAREAKYGGGNVTMSSRGGWGSSPDYGSRYPYGVMPEDDDDDLDLIQLAMAQGIAPPEPTWRDRLRTGLVGGSEALAALGAGHATDFRATDKFLAEQREQNWTKAILGAQMGGGDGGADPNATLAWLESRGHQDLVDLVKTGSYKVSDAVAEATLRDRAKGEAGTGALDPDKQATIASQLRDDWRLSTGEFKDVANNFQNVAAAYKDPSGVPDYQLLVSFVKVLDPGSVAREGEVEALRKAAPLIPGLQAVLENAISGTGSLPQEVRDEIYRLSLAKYTEQRTVMQGEATRYRQIAIDYGVNPDHVLGAELPDYTQGMPPAPEPWSVRNPAAKNAPGKAAPVVLDTNPPAAGAAAPASIPPWLR